MKTENLILGALGVAVGLMWARNSGAAAIGALKEIVGNGAKEIKRQYMSGKDKYGIIMYENKFGELWVAMFQRDKLTDIMLRADNINEADKIFNRWASY